MFSQVVVSPELARDVFVAVVRIFFFAAMSSHRSLVACQNPPSAVMVSSSFAGCCLHPLCSFCLFMALRLLLEEDIFITGILAKGVAALKG